MSFCFKASRQHVIFCRSTVCILFGAESWPVGHSVCHGTCPPQKASQRISHLSHHHPFLLLLRLRKKLAAQKSISPLPPFYSTFRELHSTQHHLRTPHHNNLSPFSPPPPPPHPWSTKNLIEAMSRIWKPKRKRKKSLVGFIFGKPMFVDVQLWQRCPPWGKSCPSKMLPFC